MVEVVNKSTDGANRFYIKYSFATVIQTAIPGSTKYTLHCFIRYLYSGLMPSPALGGGMIPALLLI